MAVISKEENAVIDKMFSMRASNDEMIVIKKSISDVKNKVGIFQDAARCKGDLHSLKFVIIDRTGLNSKVSSDLARSIWFLVKHTSDRERMIKSRVSHGTWIHDQHLCHYPSHEKLNGQKFPLRKGLRISFFNRIFPGNAVGCSCFIKPIISF